MLKKAKLETAGSAAPKQKGQAKGRELNKSFKKKGLHYAGKTSKDLGFR